jgi:hypothetical protein
VLVESQPVAALPVSVERMITAQQAMMDRMMADMDAMFSPWATPGGAVPGGLIQAMLGSAGNPRAQGGTYCAESVSVSYNGRDSQPVVKVSQAGNGCGPAAGAAPVPAVTAPPASREPRVLNINGPAGRQPRVLNISDPATPPRVQHRT